MKKIISLLLVFVLLFSCGATAFAAVDGSVKLIYGSIALDPVPAYDASVYPYAFILDSYGAPVFFASECPAILDDDGCLLFSDSSIDAEYISISYPWCEFLTFSCSEFYLDYYYRDLRYVIWSNFDIYSGEDVEFYSSEPQLVPTGDDVCSVCCNTGTYFNELKGLVNSCPLYCRECTEHVYLVFSVFKG